MHDDGQDCESCGRSGELTEKVQRMYLGTAEGEGDPPEPTAGDIEMWCASCRATYPHVLVAETD